MDGSYGVRGSEEGVECETKGWASSEHQVYENPLSRPSVWTSHLGVRNSLHKEGLISTYRWGLVHSLIVWGLYAKVTFSPRPHPTCTHPSSLPCVFSLELITIETAIYFYLLVFFAVCLLHWQQSPKRQGVSFTCYYILKDQSTAWHIIGALVWMSTKERRNSTWAQVFMPLNLNGFLTLPSCTNHNSMYYKKHQLSWAFGKSCTLVVQHREDQQLSNCLLGVLIRILQERLPRLMTWGRAVHSPSLLTKSCTCIGKLEGWRNSSAVRGWIND